MLGGVSTRTTNLTILTDGGVLQAWRGSARTYWRRTVTVSAVVLVCLLLDPVLKDWSSVAPAEHLTPQLWARQVLSTLVGWIGGTGIGALAALLVLNVWQEQQEKAKEQARQEREWKEAEERRRTHSARITRAVRQHLRSLQFRIFRIGLTAVHVSNAVWIDPPDVHPSDPDDELEEWWIALVRGTAEYLAEHEASWAQFGASITTTVSATGGGPLPWPDPPSTPPATVVRSHLHNGLAAVPELTDAFQRTEDLVMVLDRLVPDGLPDMLAAHAQLHTALDNWFLFADASTDRYEPVVSEEPLNEAELRHYPLLLEFLGSAVHAALDLYEMRIELRREFPETREDDDPREAGEPAAG